MKHINYVSGMKALEVGSFFKKYYFPGLFQSLANGKRFINKDQGLNDMMDDVPSFNLRFTNFQNKTIAAIDDSVYKHQSSSLNVEITLENHKEIEKISVFNNGKLIQEESFTEEITFRGNSSNRSTTITLAPASNYLEFSLTSKDGITTPKKSIDIFFDTISGKSELFILSLGINEYENSSYNLKYAKNDATTFAKSFDKSASPLFDNVFNYSLLDEEVTKEKVTSKIKEIEQKMGPEDVFVFYYAGHGMMYENDNQPNDFYLIMGG